MSYFTYHIPQNAVYTMEDMIHVLNHEKVHSVLARENSFYSAGSFSESIFAPFAAFIGGASSAFAPLAVLQKGSASAAWIYIPGPAEIAGVIWTLPVLAATCYITLPWMKKEIFGGGLSEVEVIYEPKDLMVNEHYTLELTTSCNKWYYYQDPEDTSEAVDYFTAREMCYMLNTNDIISTLNHQIPEEYQVPINSMTDWSSVAVIDL